MSQENVEIVRRGFEAFQAGLAADNPAAAFDAGLTPPDAEWIMPPSTPGFRQVYKGRDEFLDFLSTWTEDFEDFSIELERLIDAGDDRVVGLFHQRGIGKGSGAPVEVHTALVYELQNGQVVRMWVYLDPAEALEAAGLSE
jgi:ketosteroid isomerase-like protein